MTSHGFSLKRCLLDAMFSGLIALIIFGPIAGVVLDGYSFNFAGQRLAWMVGTVMVGRFLLSAFLSTAAGARFQARFEADSAGAYVRPPAYKSRLRWVIPLAIALAICFPFVATKYLLTVAILGLIYVLLGLGLNIVVGLAGLLDLGYVAFYAIGAYGLALGYQYLGLGFWSMLPLAAIMAAAAGALLGFPVLRMHGDYLAIVTLGFGEIVRILLLNNTEITGGPNGISQIPKPTFFGLEFSRSAREGGWDTFSNFFGVKYDPSDRVIFLYLVALLLVVLSLFVINRLLRMPLGRAWEALREDEIACRSLGLSPTRIKLTAFTISAAFAGFAGTLFAARQGFVSPESFTFAESAFVLAIVVLGGMGSQFAVILAAILLVVSRELMRDFNEYSMLMLGGLMVLMMIWRPQGLLPMTRVQLKLKNGQAKGEQA